MTQESKIQGPRVVLPEPAAPLRGWALPLIVVAALVISVLTVSWVYELAVRAAAPTIATPLQFQIGSARAARYESDDSRAIRLVPTAPSLPMAKPE